MSAQVVPFSRPVVTEDALRAGVQALSSGWLTTGPQCAAFEDEFATWIGAEHAITVSSCTAAIELVLRGMHLPKGAHVLVPAITFCGVAGAIQHAGLVPVLADVDPVTVMITPATARAAATAAGGVDAAVLLHYAGEPTDVEAVAEAVGLPRNRIIEDAAHAVGTWAGPDRVGSHSFAACFSFYATKNLPIGEGGMVTTDDAELEDYLRRARLHGMSRDAWRRYAPGGSWRYDVVEDGLKANLPEVCAAVGRAQLRHVDDWQSRRSAIAATYSELLANLPGLELPADVEQGRHAWHLYVLRITADARRGRDTLSEDLAAAGIGTSVHFIPLHHLTHFRSTTSAPVPLAGADSVFPRLLSLPIYPSLTDDEIDRVCAVVTESLSFPTNREVFA